METAIRLNEHGDEAHESWLLIRANHVTSTPGARLFDSEIAHQRYVVVTVARCRRRRDLNHDWLSNGETLLEMSMSQAQWGAFVSSFGQGAGVPATLERLIGVGDVPRSPVESRLGESHREVREAADESLSTVQAAFAHVERLFEAKAGRREMSSALRDLHFALKNAPANMEFVAKSLTEHAENVVTKARADIEGMVLAAIDQGELSESTVSGLLGDGR